jgi:hypothetical protein
MFRAYAGVHGADAVRLRDLAVVLQHSDANTRPPRCSDAE